MKVWKPQTAYALKQGPAWDDLMDEVASCMTVEAVWTWWHDYLVHRHRNFPEVWSLALRERCESREEELLSGLHHAELDEAFRMTVGAPERPTSLRGTADGR